MSSTISIIPSYVNGSTSNAIIGDTSIADGTLSGQLNTNITGPLKTYYTTTTTITIPQFVTQMTVKLWGAGGNAGSSGGSGGGGGYAFKTVTVKSGQSYIITIGQPSQGGSSTFGGAGGGMSILQSSNPFTTLAIAGGGGGGGSNAGGGGGQKGFESSGQNGGSPGSNGSGGAGGIISTGTAAGSAGSAYISNSGGGGGNGNGGGGGGAGYGGGGSGNTSAGNNGSGGGGGGNFGDTTANGALTVPGNNADTDYPGSNFAVGGSVGSATGKQGYAVVTFNYLTSSMTLIGSYIAADTTLYIGNNVSLPNGSVFFADRIVGADTSADMRIRPNQSSKTLFLAHDLSDCTVSINRSVYSPSTIINGSINGGQDNTPVLQYSVGTISQSGTTITLASTDSFATFNAAMVGGILIPTNGSPLRITAFLTTTTLTVSTSQILSSTAYTIFYNFSNTNHGYSISPHGNLFLKTNSTGTAVMPVITMIGSEAGTGATMAIDASTYLNTGTGTYTTGRLAFVDDGNASTNLTYSARIPGSGNNDLSGVFVVGSTGLVSVRTLTSSGLITASSGISLPSGGTTLSYYQELTQTGVTVTPNGSWISGPTTANLKYVRVGNAVTCSITNTISGNVNSASNPAIQIPTGFIPSTGSINIYIPILMAVSGTYAMHNIRLDTSAGILYFQPIGLSTSIPAGVWAVQPCTFSWCI